MLLEFTVQNFRSFADATTLSLVAANLEAEDKAVDRRNVFAPKRGLALLRSAALYGANASGKTNLLLAMRYARALVLRSARLRAARATIGVEPFRLNRALATHPSQFEWVLLVDGVETRYGFEVDTQQVVGEWCFQRTSAKERRLFVRRGDDFALGDGFAEGRGLEARTRRDALFLSVVAQFNGPLASALVEWFRRLTVTTSASGALFRGRAVRAVEEGRYGGAVVDLVRELDVGISDIRIERPREPDVDADGPTPLFPAWAASPPGPRIYTTHQTYTAEGALDGAIEFEFARHESAGTQKVFALSGLFLDVLRGGGVLVVDELDAQLHPHLTAALVRLFNGEDTNPANAQLIFTTHDTHLLDRRWFRRDQIWIADKSRVGATRLRSLAQFRGVRNDGAFEAQYLRGQFGGIPILGDPGGVLVEETSTDSTPPQPSRSGRSGDERRPSTNAPDAARAAEQAPKLPRASRARRTPS